MFYKKNTVLLTSHTLLLFFLVNASRIAGWFFLFCFDCATIKTPSLYDNAHLHSSLTEIIMQKFSICRLASSGKRKIFLQSMMLKTFYLYGFARWTKCIWWAIENNYLLVNKLLEFAVEWIPAIRNKAEINFSSKNCLYYCNCW